MTNRMAVTHLVDGDKSGQSSNTVTGKNSTTDELSVVVGRSGLDGDTNEEDTERNEVGRSKSNSALW